MKKFTSLMLMLLCAVTAWAGTFDLPEMSTEGNIKWYTIKNTRSNKYATFNGDAAQMTQQAAVGLNSLFYFTASNAETAEGFTPVMIHNYGTENMLADWAKWTAEGKAWFISTTTNSGTGAGQGLHISNSAKYEGWNSWNDGGSSSITNYVADDAGSIFVIEEANMTSIVADAKTAAKAKLENYALLTNVFPATTDYIARIEAVSNDGGFESMDAITVIVNDYIKTAGNKYFTINTPERGNSGYMQMTTAKVVGTKTAATPANLWQFVENNGNVNIFNPYTGLYMCATGGDSQPVAVTANQAEAGAYTFQAAADNKVKIGVNGANIHMDSGATLVRWDEGGASEWIVTPVENFSTMIGDYKTATIATLDEWAKLSVVFDAQLVASAKAAINAINTNSYATFATIDAALVDVTDAVAAKMFTFRNTDTATAARTNAYLSVNAGTAKGCGTQVFDYNAVWSLRHASGTSFYLYNELNSVYLANPGNGGLTADATAAYSFEIVDAATSKAELKCGNETLHLSNGLGLMSYDFDDPASRWIIGTIDIAAEIQTILDGLTEEDYADVPALGQYPTAAYNALVEARTSAKTVEEVNAAITAFNKAKNRPVFTISGTKDYVVGKSIYDDSDAAPNFKATNKYDKTMLWAFDQTATTVGITESVDVVNYATNKGFWGAKSLKVTDTSDANAEDGIFLFYTVGNGTPLHFQNDGQVIVRYGSTESTSGSAVTFTYVGNTYDIDKLSDAQLAAASELLSAYTSSKNVALGTAVGLYTDATGNFAAAKAAAKAILDKNLDELAAVEDINAAKTAIASATAALSLNVPATGKYYRLKNVKSGNYMSDNDGVKLLADGAEAASTIFYLGENNTLLSYTKGQYLDCAEKAFAAVGESKNGAFGVAHGGATANVITYKNNGYWTFGGGAEGAGLDRGSSNPNDAGYNWTIEEVTVLPVAISAAKYATFFAPVAVELEDGVTAHTVTVDGTTAVLSEAMTVIPANTGVILAGNEGTYNFTIATAAAFEGENLMNGTVAKTVVTKATNTEYYVLAKVDDVVGMYVANNGETTTTEFTNGSHKAYLAVEGANGIKSFSFRIPGTTGIENVVVENGVNVIFDLTGRKVESISAPGIYIVNGKKVLVK